MVVGIDRRGAPVMALKAEAIRGDDAVEFVQRREIDRAFPRCGEPLDITTDDVGLEFRGTAVGSCRHAFAENFGELRDVGRQIGRISGGGCDLSRFGCARRGGTEACGCNACGSGPQKLPPGEAGGASFLLFGMSDIGIDPVYSRDPTPLGCGAATRCLRPRRLSRRRSASHRRSWSWHVATRRLPDRRPLGAFIRRSPNRRPTFSLSASRRLAGLLAA